MAKQKPILKWQCDACGEAENCDASCVVEVYACEPEICPISGDDCEWRPYTEKVCKWKYDEIEEIWVTTCEEAWGFPAGNPEENNCKFCPMCGRKIVEQALKGG